MRVADLYIRVSTDEQADKGYSQRGQEEVLLKYCSLNHILVRNRIFEDHSAKTFERPAWKKLLNSLHKSQKPDLILFTKWDRFSRNAGDAYMMISTLRKLGVEPQAIEQPLDLTVPENKMMLAFYLAVPEVENDRRALNVIHGMRRAWKEGRYLRKAPFGYVNTLNESGDKCIAPKEPKAGIIKWIFTTIAEGNYRSEQVWKQAKKDLGLKMSKNSFWYILRNPVYCGKVLVPAYKDEQEQLVKGQHEPLISESLFFDVQDILNGRRRKVRKTTLYSMDEIPLRGFLNCPECNRTLTGSASKGRKQYYHYYHCSSSCGVRFKAGEVNGGFVHELKKFKPLPGMGEIYKELISEAYHSNTTSKLDNRKTIIKRINEENERISKARDLLLSDDIDAQDFQIIKSESNQKINELELRLYACEDTPKIEIKPLLEKAFEVVCNLDKFYEMADVKLKRKVIGSIYPENLTFSGNNFRTTRVNAAVDLIYQMNSQLRGKKNGTKPVKSALYQRVGPSGLEPGQ